MAFGPSAAVLGIVGRRHVEESHATTFTEQLDWIRVLFERVDGHFVEACTDANTGVTYMGHATAWGNFNMNQRNQASAFTLTIHAVGSDGSSFFGHETTVFALNANGDLTVNFDKMNLTCSA